MKNYKELIDESGFCNMSKDDSSYFYNTTILRVTMAIEYLHKGYPYNKLHKMVGFSSQKEFELAFSSIVD